MARANAAYYATRDPFADFTTAPEISQVFGEVLGLWAAVTWSLLGSPAPIMLIEAGPGRGTLMADALRAIRRAAPDFAAAARVRFIETSPRLRAIQAEAVPDAQWHDRLEDVPDGPFLLLANEFLDALPIRQFVRRGKGWAERWVRDGAFEERAVEGLGFTPPDPVQEGGIVERCEPALAVVSHVAQRLARHPGAALFLDYGPERSTAGDSLQALAGGRPADPLSPPGAADLTAHVDFSSLTEAARAGGAAVQGPVPQGMFLARLGLFQRANRLARHRPPAEAFAIMEGARRLGEPDRMGRLFKVLALTRAGAPGLPGFEA
ncbi:MAG: class I SAM-dependent methyltransferase [Acetobacteraceae bacterium]